MSVSNVMTTPVTTGRRKDHAGEATQDSQREKERNPVDGQERAGQRGIDGANERQPAQIAADRSIDLVEHVPIQVPRFGARLIHGGVDQTSPKDQHERRQQQDRHGRTDKAEDAAHRGQNGRGCALQHGGQSLLELLDVIGQVKTSIEVPEQATVAGVVMWEGACSTRAWPCEIAGGISVNPSPVSNPASNMLTTAIERERLSPRRTSIFTP